MPSTLLAFETLSNIRDLGGMPADGGHTIRPGRLLRCGHLADLSDKDVGQLSGSVSMIIDFRSFEEQKRQPDREIPGAAYHHIPIVESLTAGITREEEADRNAIALLLFKPEEARQYMCNQYRSFAASPLAVSGYAQFFRLLLENGSSDKAALWHCTAGKDRAGIGAVLVQEALGVPRGEITADYLYTRECLAGEIRFLSEYIKKEVGTDSPLADRSLRYLFGTEEEFLAVFYETVKEKYGSMEAFLEKGLGIREDERSALRSFYLS